VVLRFWASKPPDHEPRLQEEKGLTVRSLSGTIVQLGGEARFAVLSAAENCALAEVLRQGTEASGRLVKWVLLTPAIFAHGWRPSWIGETGEVKLRVVTREQRQAWRKERVTSDAWYEGKEAQAPAIAARLVAARVDKPRVIGGWDLLPEHKGEKPKGGRPTFLAVPAGSIYYFEATNDTEARRLVQALHLRCRSDFFGEKGLGLGVCSRWQPSDNIWKKKSE